MYINCQPVVLHSQYGSSKCKLVIDRQNIWCARKVWHLRGCTLPLFCSCREIQVNLRILHESRLLNLSRSRLILRLFSLIHTAYVFNLLLKIVEKVAKTWVRKLHPNLRNKSAPLFFSYVKHSHCCIKIALSPLQTKMWRKSVFVEIWSQPEKYHARVASLTAGKLVVFSHKTIAFYHFYFLYKYLKTWSLLWRFRIKKQPSKVKDAHISNLTWNMMHLVLCS